MVPLRQAIELTARRLMHEVCPFDGVSGDFDRCSSLTRQTYETMAAETFGLTLSEYYALADEVPA